MQRLYSMFPRSWPGVALVLLRLSVSATVLIDSPSMASAATGFWIAVLLSLLLSAGMFTPIVAALACAFELVCLLSNFEMHSRLLVGAANAAILALLGPGAYSIDALRFGRRVITASRR